MKVPNSGIEYTCPHCKKRGYVILREVVYAWFIDSWWRCGYCNKRFSTLQGEKGEF